MFAAFGPRRMFLKKIKGREWKEVKDGGEIETEVDNEGEDPCRSSGNARGVLYIWVSEYMNAISIKSVEIHCEFFNIAPLFLFAESHTLKSTAETLDSRMEIWVDMRMFVDRNNCRPCIRDIVESIINLNSFFFGSVWEKTCHFNLP